MTSTINTTRSVALSSPADPLTLTGQTDTFVINGQTYTSTFDQIMRLLRTTTLTRRSSTAALDACPKKPGPI